MVPAIFDPVIWKAMFLVLGLIAFDVFLGIVLAIKTKTFDVRLLPGFLQTDILPIVLPLFGLAVMAMWYPDLRTAFLGATGFVTLMYMAHLKDKLTQLTGYKFEVNLFMGVRGIRLYRAGPVLTAAPLLCFGSALAAMKEGKKVARAGWNGKGMYVRIVVPMGSIDGGQMQRYVTMKTVQGTFVPWLASQTDLLAEDWFVVT